MSVHYNQAGVARLNRITTNRLKPCTHVAAGAEATHELRSGILGVPNTMACAKCAERRSYACSEEAREHLRTHKVTPP